MKLKLFIIFIIFTAISGALFSDTEKVRFALSPFTALTESADAENAGTLAASILEGSLAKGKWFDLRKSGELENFTENLALAQAGLGNEAQVMAAGKNLRIKYLTVGSVAKFGSHYEVDSRSVNIDNWGIMHSSGCAAIDIESACNYINKDVEITLTKENLDEKEKNTDKLPVITVDRFQEGNTDAQNIGYGGSFAEVLNSELGARASISAIERTHLRSVIDAKAMELCGIYGNDTNKDFGERGIKYKVDGEIKIYPSTICIRYQVTTTESGRTVLLGFSEINSVNGIRPLARRIAREIDEALNNRIGTLQIKTAPSSADILIDGHPYGKSPVLISLPKGKHAIRAMFSGYETTDEEINLEPARINDKTITLKRISTQIYDQAIALEQKKNWAGAIAKYDEFISKYSTSDDVNKALYRKGHIMLLFMNNSKGALETFEALVKRYPDAETRAEAYFGLARSYQAMGNNELLKQTLDILTKKFPNEIATEEAKMYFKL